jgi:hypothetical protein
MATGKKLKDIAIIPAPGQVGVSFIFEDSPTEHFLLSTAIAEQVSEKLGHAVTLAKQPPPGKGDSAAGPAKLPSRPPGDGMGLSDYSSMSIVTPKKEH